MKQAQDHPGTSTKAGALKSLVHPAVRDKWYTPIFQVILDVLNSTFRIPFYSSPAAPCCRTRN